MGRIIMLPYTERALISSFPVITYGKSLPLETDALGLFPPYLSLHEAELFMECNSDAI